MATTIEAPPEEQLRTVHRHNRWLVIAVVVLAVALVGLGAWVVYDQVTQPATAASDEIATLLDSYTAAWNDADSAAFLALTTDGYTFSSAGDVTGRTDQAAVISLGAGAGLEIQQFGDAVVISDGTDHYVAVANEIAYGGSDHVGISSFHIVETDDGMKVAAHSWVGNL